MEFKRILYEKADEIATITKNNPPLNGMSRDVVLEMRAALEDAKNDDDIRVVVITAGGDGYHYGAVVIPEQLKDLTEKEGDKLNARTMKLRELIQLGQGLYRMIETLEKPVIGVAKAGAIGGGMETLHACDFVIAAENAVFSQPEPIFGLIAGWGGTQRLPRIVGWRKAKEMLLALEEITGKEAESIGLINKAVPEDNLEMEVRALAEKLMRGAPEALALTKLAMNKVWETGLTTGLDYEVEAESVAMSCENFFEAMEALGEGREPLFKKLERMTSGPEWS